MINPKKIQIVKSVYGHIDTCSTTWSAAWRCSFAREGYKYSLSKV